jgi:hypothetical protein
LKAVSLGAVRARRWRRVVPILAPSVLFAAAGLFALAFAFATIGVIFQLFFRYEYLENGGVLWRIDRVTQQMCQVRIGDAKCAADPPASFTRNVSTSTSTSLSTSLSTSGSTSLQVAPRYRRKYPRRLPGAP